MKDGVERLILAVVVLALIIGGVTCQIMQFNECRRVHPLWYCTGDKR